MSEMANNSAGELIAAAAIRCDGQVFSGPTHFAVMKKIIQLDLPAALKCEMLRDGEDGFSTDTGRFVSREEGFMIAKSSGQIAGELGDPEKNRAFYGGDKPRLDSGMIESFAPFKLRPGCPV